MPGRVTAPCGEVRRGSAAPRKGGVGTVVAPESGCLGMQPKAGGKPHPKLNTGERPIANKYREGKMKRTLRRESKAPEIVGGKRWMPAIRARPVRACEGRRAARCYWSAHGCSGWSLRRSACGRGCPSSVSLLASAQVWLADGPGHALGGGRNHSVTGRWAGYPCPSAKGLR